MSGARLSAISHLRGGVGVPFDRRWLFGIAAMAVGTTLIIGVIAVFAGNVLAGVVAVLFTGLVSLIAYVFMLIMWPIILLLLPPLTALLEKFEINPGKLVADLNKELDRIKAGSPRIGETSIIQIFPCFNE